MNSWRRSRLLNPASWYTAIGMALLGLSLWLPWASASRTARVEQRADQIADALLLAARGDAPLDDPAALDHVLARLHALAAARAVFVADLERQEPPPDALLLLTNKHYAFQLAVSPVPQNERVGRDTVPALEVVAWPLSRVGPGHCAFFHPENAPRAYTRNLAAGYAGTGRRRPAPGKCHRSAASSDHPSSYRSDDDERWLLY